jgi:2-dehydro-3-deoxyphosphogluconate aldolase / (4S)-4-hydroxy-2-oxoglutarate aldolase
MDYTEMEARLRVARVVPVVTVATEERGCETVDRLVEAGASLVEIALRSQAAMKVLATTRKRHPHIALAAGTVLDPTLYDAAVSIGADFAVSPGFDKPLAEYARNGSMPLVPGAVTASEVMVANRLGYTILKFYPAEPTISPAVLADYANVFPKTQFMPSGPMSPSILPAYAVLPNVLCFGGNWLFADGTRLRTVEEIAELLASGAAAFDPAS